MDSILDMGDEANDIFEYPEGDIPMIKTPVFIPVEFAEYSPLEQDVYTMWEVVDQLASAANAFSDLESTLSLAAPEQLPNDTDEDTLFWFIEALNIFANDCQDVAMQLVNFSEYVETLLFGEKQATLAPPVRILPRGSFSERDMKEVLESAANLPKEEVAKALAALEIEVPPSPMGSQRPRDRPPSLTLSTSDVVLLPPRLPRSRKQSVGAVGRFSESTSDPECRDKDVLKKHRAYVVYGDETPTSAEDNWSAKSIVDYGVDSPFDENGQPRRSPLPPRGRPSSRQTAILVPRPLSSPVTLGTTLSPARRPPSLTLSDSQSPRSSRSTSSSISSLFSNLPRTFASITSPRTSPRRSTTFDMVGKVDQVDKPRFPAPTGNLKKVFTSIFKRKEKEGGFTFPEKENQSKFGMANLGSTLRTSLPKRPFGRRPAASGSVDATLSALALSGPMSTSQIILNADSDPFAATPPASAHIPPPPVPQPTALDGYSSMFNPLKAASRYPTKPLFGGVGEEHLDGGKPQY
ncbi:hypothetical protein GSI_12908 [Ganoderma sinense ZZ0214-1]|uniref:Uncharacterized protein n=1 Tax=Ganoderma sinense ZZ0214-1 TaxID=1077348 RepID=A0A2G8RU34_9APHY|nr:hypothetical protein GSI_12908 [Ganoderma sinense ZZ0214-1]